MAPMAAPSGPAQRIQTVRPQNNVYTALLLIAALALLAAIIYGLWRLNDLYGIFAGQ